MFSIKKLLFSIASLSLTVPIISVVDSCSKIKKSPSVDVKLSSNDVKMFIKRKANISVTNFSYLKSLGLTSNLLINIADENIAQIDDSANDSKSNITFKGKNEGKTSATITFTDIITQRQATGKIDITVQDSNQFNVVYDKEIGKDKSHPIKINDNSNKNLDLGHIDEKYWKKIDQKHKDYFVANISNKDDSHTDIKNFFDIKINDQGHIIATHKDSVFQYALGQFHVQITSTDPSFTAKDDGSDFWFEEKKDDLILNFEKPDNISIPYNGDIISFNKTIRASATIQIKKDDWATIIKGKDKDKLNKELAEIANKNNPVNPILIPNFSNFSFDEVDPSNSDGKLKLNFDYKNVSSGTRKLSVQFSFSIEDDKSKVTGQKISGNIDLTVNPFRHGVSDIEKSNDHSNNEVQPDTFTDRGKFDFNKDAGLDKLAANGKLMQPFEFKLSSLYSGPVANLKGNYYEYDQNNENSTVVLTYDSFNSIGDLNIGHEEDPEKIKAWNEKIENLHSGEAESKYADTSRVSITAKLVNLNDIVISCPGIKRKPGEKTVNLDDGEYYIVSKFKDNMGNYQILFTQFYWKSVKITSGPIQFNLQLMNMPITKDEQNNSTGDGKAESAMSSLDINNGVIASGDYNGGKSNPLMLAPNDIDISAPRDGNFKDDKNPYRGCIEVQGPDDALSKSSKVEVFNDNQSVVSSVNSQLIEKDGKFYVGLKIKGQGVKDTPSGHFDIKITSQLSDSQIVQSTSIYYAAYVGADSNDLYDINDGIEKDSQGLPDGPVSVYVAKTAKNRPIYLGISSDVNSSVKNAYFEGGVSYEGSLGLLSLDLPPSKREINKVPKQVTNITFGGEVNVKGSYVIYNAFQQGVNGILTFCGDVNFNSQNNYLGTEGNNQDKELSTSGIIITGESRKDSQSTKQGDETYLSKYGVRFGGDVKIVTEGSIDKRDNEKLTVIGITGDMFSGNITFDNDITINSGVTDIYQVGVYVYENLQTEKDFNYFEQDINNQLIKGSVTITAVDVDLPTHNLYKGIIVDIGCVYFRTRKADFSPDDRSSTITIGQKNSADSTACSINSTYINKNGGGKENRASIVTSAYDNNTDSGRKLSSVLPKIEIKGKFINNDDEASKAIVSAVLLCGTYSHPSGASMNYVHFFGSDGQSYIANFTDSNINFNRVYMNPQFLNASPGKPS